MADQSNKKYLVDVIDEAIEDTRHLTGLPERAKEIIRYLNIRNFQIIVKPFISEDD